MIVLIATVAPVDTSSRHTWCHAASHRAHVAGCQRWYHTYVEKTTVYFPAELKRAVNRYASRRGLSEAEVIRRAVADAVAGDEIPRPRSALFSSEVLMADDVDTHLDGFGLQ